MTKSTNVELNQADNVENIRSVQSAKYENELESLAIRFDDQLVEPVRATNYSDGTEYNMGEMDFTIQMNQEIPALHKRLEKVLKFIQMTEDSIKRIDVGGGIWEYGDQFFLVWGKHVRGGLAFLWFYGKSILLVNFIYV